MAKKKKSKDSERGGHARSALPTKDQLVAFVSAADGEVSKRDIARAFHLDAAQRAALKAIIKELINDGVLARGHKRRVTTPESLPPVLMVEITELDLDGEPVGRPLKWQGDGVAPAITIVPDGRRRGTAVGIGDRALVRLRERGGKRLEARVIRRLGGKPSRVVGVFQSLAGGGGRVRPSERGARHEFAIAEADTAGARNNELVIVETDRSRKLGLPTAKVVNRLGDMESPGAISRLMINSHGIPDDFPADVLAQAEKAAAPEAADRVDLRDLALVTIDDEDARDFDDAVWAAPDDDADNRNGWHIVVAIADVAYYVRAGDAIDREARKRGNSVYFPDRVVPMLPEALSNDWCSLRPGQDRACIAAHIWIDRHGNMLRSRFERAIMRSTARLTYRAVQAAHDGQAPLPDDAARLIAPLYGAFEALSAARARRGTLDLDLPERRVRLDDGGNILSIDARPRYASHRVIEEFMIAANVAVAELLTARLAPCLYRIHDQPPAAKLEPLREFLGSLGYKLSRARHLTATHFNQILRKSAGQPEAELVATVVLRAQSQAEYAPHNIGHFGLDLHRYAHFTSPIRRYADLIVHRSLIRQLKLGVDGLSDDAAAMLDSIGQEVSATERRAVNAERDALDHYAARFLTDKIGASFDARVSGATRFGLFIALDQTGAEGLIPMRHLGEYFRHDADRHRLIGTETGHTYGLGDSVRVRLVEADSVTGALRFELVDHDVPPHIRGREPKRSGRRRRKHR